MKLTKQKLKKIIMEELKEAYRDVGYGIADPEKQKGVKPFVWHGKESSQSMPAMGGQATLTDDPLESLKAIVETWSPPRTAESQTYYFDVISLLDHFEPGTLDRLLPKQDSGGQK